MGWGNCKTMRSNEGADEARALLVASIRIALHEARKGLGVTL
jgi:hypothetical protein